MSGPALQPVASADAGQPSAWIRRFAHLLPHDAEVLDVACGSGRHLRFLAEVRPDLRLHGVDRDAVAVEPLHELARITVADIEQGPWPFAGRAFGGLLVTNYLWRPRWPDLAAALAPGGVLLYETFARGHEAIGRPSRPDFLLQPGELLRWATSTGWQVVAFEEGLETEPHRVVQRIAAVRPPAFGAGGVPAPPRLARVSA